MNSGYWLSFCQTLTANRYGLGYGNQISVSFSGFAIKELGEKLANLVLEWEATGVRKMSLEDDFIDVAIDKVVSKCRDKERKTGY